MEKLKAIPLSEMNNQDVESFVQLVRQQIKEEIRQEEHQCWMFIPSPQEYAMMQKYYNNSTCPKCKKGRVVLEVYHGNIGDAYWLRCYWGDDGCDFKESATGDDY